MPLQSLFLSSCRANPDDDDTLTVMSYNVENFFHPGDDPAKSDDDFTPEGVYHWTFKRAARKANMLSRVITLGDAEGHLPDIVGLCEVEGPAAMKLLYEKGGLNNPALGYKWVCFDTPDARGIAPGILYREEKLRFLNADTIYASCADSDFVTRNILYAKFALQKTSDTLHVFVNHWPSKYGGAAATRWKRMRTARICRGKCDSLLTINPHAKVLLMGDFNETAKSTELKTLCEGGGTKLENLSGKDPRGYKSYNYQGDWSTIDHIIVTPALCSLFADFRIMSEDFMLERDKKGRKKPKRTYVGRKYNEGYSDHLPIIARFTIK